jgi:hypothetical protein
VLKLAGRAVNMLCGAGHKHKNREKKGEKVNVFTSGTKIMPYYITKNFKKHKQFQTTYLNMTL